MPKGIFKRKPHTEKSKRKTSESLKGIKRSEKTKKQMSEVRLGKKFSEEHKRKLSESHKGKKLTEKTRKLISFKGKGEKHWNWKGGVTPINQKIRQSFDYKEWRMNVFVRDNFECQKCFQERGKYITAHHIKSFAHYPDLRFDINNGITLCENCHSLTDNYKAKGKNKPKIKF